MPRLLRGFRGGSTRTFSLSRTLRLGDGPLSSALTSNQAACLLKLGQWKEAEKRASSALVAEPSNSKAVYRRGLARLRLGDGAGAVEARAG